jgi:hypothetical protein
MVGDPAVAAVADRGLGEVEVRDRGVGGRCGSTSGIGWVTALALAAAQPVVAVPGGGKRLAPGGGYRSDLGHQGRARINDSLAQP